MKQIIIAVIMLVVCVAMVNAMELNKCDTLSVAGETYTLTSNVSTNWTTCFIIIAPNITLDCNGFSIRGNNALNIYNVYSRPENTNIKNCNVPVLTPDNVNVLENSSREALFDIIADIVAEPKQQGEDLIIKISLINFGTPDTVDAKLKYMILDDYGQTIKQYTKIVKIKTQTEFLEHINTTELEAGKYQLKLDLRYAGQAHPAVTEAVFYVGKVGLLEQILRSTTAKLLLVCAVGSVLFINVFRRVTRTLIT